MTLILAGAVLGAVAGYIQQSAPRRSGARGRRALRGG